jgi:hypothetical protein
MQRDVFRVWWSYVRIAIVQNGSQMEAKWKHNGTVYAAGEVLAEIGIDSDVIDLFQTLC